jgi:hypothetical protein
MTDEIDAPPRWRLVAWWSLIIMYQLTQTAANTLRLAARRMRSNR